MNLDVAQVVRLILLLIEAIPHAVKLVEGLTNAVRQTVAAMDPEQREKAQVHLDELSKAFDALEAQIKAVRFKQV